MDNFVPITAYSFILFYSMHILYNKAVIPPSCIDIRFGFCRPILHQHRKLSFIPYIFNTCPASVRGSGALYSGMSQRSQHVLHMLLQNSQIWTSSLVLILQTGFYSFPITGTVLTLTPDLMGGIEEPDTGSRVLHCHIDLLLHRATASIWDTNPWHSTL